MYKQNIARVRNCHGMFSRTCFAKTFEKFPNKLLWHNQWHILELMIIVITPGAGLTIHTVEDVSSMLIRVIRLRLNGRTQSPHIPQWLSHSVAEWLELPIEWLLPLPGALIHIGQFSVYSVHCISIQGVSVPLNAVSSGHPAVPTPLVVD